MYYKTLCLIPVAALNPKDIYLYQGRYHMSERALLRVAQKIQLDSPRGVEVEAHTQHSGAIVHTAYKIRTTLRQAPPPLCHPQSLEPINYALLVTGFCQKPLLLLRPDGPAPRISLRSHHAPMGESSSQILEIEFTA